MAFIGHYTLDQLPQGMAAEQFQNLPNATSYRGRCPQRPMRERQPDSAEQVGAKGVTAGETARISTYTPRTSFEPSEETAGLIHRLVKGGRTLVLRLLFAQTSRGRFTDGRFNSNTETNMEIDLYSRLQDPIAAIEKMGEWFTRSGMFKCTRVEGGKMLALICVVEKKSPIEVNRQYHIMEDGTITPKARDVHAKFLARGGKIEWIRDGEEEVEFDKLDASAKFSFGDQSRVVTFTMAKARTQQLPVDNAKSNWRKNPGAMLRARLITKGVDMFCPDINQGGGDDDYDRPERPGPNIDLASTPATQTTVKVEPVPTPAPAAASEPARVIDAQVLPADPPKPAAPAPTPPAPAGEGLPADVVAEVEKVISSKGPEFRARCLAWMVGNGKLLPGQEINALPSSMGSQIMNRGAAFLRAVESYKVAA